MGKHRSMAYFPVLTGRDEMSKQARFIIRMALACHEAGTPYDVQWKRDTPSLPKIMPRVHSKEWLALQPRMVATITAEGAIPMPQPFPKAPKAPRLVSDWRPNPYRDASYRPYVWDIKRKGKTERSAGWVIEHSSGLCLVKLGQSDSGEFSDAEDPTLDWHVAHGSMMTLGVCCSLNRAADALAYAASFGVDWHKPVAELKADPDKTAHRAQQSTLAQFGDREQRSDAAAALEKLDSLKPTTPEPPTTPAPAMRTRTSPKPPVDAVAKLAANEARIAQIQSQLAGDTQARLNRLLAELRASRPPAPAGKLAVTYPDGRVGYIPDPAADRRVSA